jgi:hypothetical protein
LLNQRKIRKGALDQLYAQRWNVELDLRNIKITLGVEVLRCLTPRMVEKELWVHRRQPARTNRTAGPQTSTQALSVAEKTAGRSS